jgi:hypothetical protein
MIRPTKTQVVVASGISLDDFASDVPHAPRSAGANAASNAGIIDGVTATALIANADDRGSLSELLTTRDGPIARNTNASPAFAVERNDRLNGELMVRAHIGERRVHRRCGLLPLRRDDDGRMCLQITRIATCTTSASRIETLRDRGPQAPTIRSGRPAFLGARTVLAPTLSKSVFR